MSRPRNADKYKEEIASLNDAIAHHYLEIFEKGMELVRGVTIGKMRKGKLITYSVPPCAKMIMFYTERFAGKATQAVEVTGQDGGPIAIAFEEAIARVYGHDAAEVGNREPGDESDPEPDPFPD